MEQTFKEQLKQILDKYKYGGINVLLFDKTNILEQASLGYQTIENQQPINLNTIFRIASISKVIVALGIMKLVEENKVDINEDISTYLGFTLRNPHFPNHKITLKHLMTQTSSISDGTQENTGYDGVNGPIMEVSLQELLTNPNYQYYSDKTFLNKEPGSYFEYSNFGCGILACIIEKVTNEYFTDYIRRILLLPLGLDASFRVSDIVNQENIVSLYIYENDLPCLLRNQKLFNENQFPRYSLGNNFRGPAGGLFISITDLMKIAQMLMNKGTIGGREIYKKETINLMEKEAWRGNTYDSSYKAKGLQLNLLELPIWPYTNEKGFKGHFGSAYGALTFMFYNSEFGMIFFCSGTNIDKHDDGIQVIERDVLYYLINYWDQHFNQEKRLLSKETMQIIQKFIKDRNWEQFHTGENLAKSLVLEASELLELYQWSSEVNNIEDLKEELADVFVYAIDILNKYQFDINEIIQNKMKKNSEKYPVEKSFGNSNKYNKLN